MLDDPTQFVCIGLIICLFFFCSSQLQPPCERGLMALCALGLISSDATLAGAALGELMKRGNGEMKQRGLKKKKCDTQ